MAIYHSFGNFKGQATELNNIGSVYENLDKYSKALAIDKINFPREEAMDISNIGVLED